MGPNIVMFRIDERLIHGQGQLWIKALGCNTVIVANDQAANGTAAAYEGCSAQNHCNEIFHSTAHM